MSQWSPVLETGTIGDGFATARRFHLVSMESGLRDRNNPKIKPNEIYAPNLSQWSPVLETGTIWVAHL